METASKSNFVQEFQKLLLTSPRYNLKHVMAENCDYADTAVKSKNCYYSFGVFYCEDVYYSRYSRKCRDCNGVTFCVGCELCTECVACLNCYQCAFCQNCQDCKDCKFSIDCFSCSDCFGCVGLYQKKYWTNNLRKMNMWNIWQRWTWLIWIIGNLFSRKSKNFAKPHLSLMCINYEPRIVLAKISPRVKTAINVTIRLPRKIVFIILKQMQIRIAVIWRCVLKLNFHIAASSRRCVITAIFCTR